MALPRQWWIMLLGGGVILGSLVLQPVSPYQMRLPGAGPFPEMSPFHAVTGLPGPTCGLTRSFVNTAHLHIYDGFRAHVLGPIIFFGLVAVWSRNLFQVVAGIRRPGGSEDGLNSQDLHEERPPDRWRPFLLPIVLLFVVTWVAKLLLGWY